ncbi:ATP-binding protein [Nocardiopsis quinghaiensis]|uniref:ATP-binding protein n=1 Tax=Nocardiopsis quinghaiensis TaxID=464995 RepID=UPI0012392FEC|nr:ATP-binding protein [Nocardiopsis quinghaiensis]
MEQRENVLGGDAAEENQATRLPRRTTDPRDRAAILVERAPGNPGHSLTLAGVPEQAAVLRRRLASAAALPPRSAELVQELASELFNNAVTHSRSGCKDGEVAVTLHRLRGRVQVRVTDQGPRAPGAATPHLRPLDTSAESGRGLRLVAAQASRWGTLHEDGRTTVWFELDRRPARGRGSRPGSAVGG